MISDSNPGFSTLFGFAGGLQDGDTVGDNTPIDKIIDRRFDRYEAIDRYLEKEGLEGKSCD